MAAEKTTKRRLKATKGGAGGAGSMLRLRTDPRKERRYEPEANAAAWLSMLGMSIGAVLLGAGVYGQWLRASIRPDTPEPHKYAVYLLLGAAVLLAVVALFRPGAARPIRVGDAGLAVEKDAGELDRIEWRDVTRVLLGGGVLTFQSSGSVLAIPLKLHPQAAARAADEARARIPAMLAGVDLDGLPALDGSAGEVLPLDPPQLAGARCKASEELIAFEKDARLCGQCGEVYHKDHVPERCLTCEAKLK
jgi:hypothetical protein